MSPAAYESEERDWDTWKAAGERVLASAKATKRCGRGRGRRPLVLVDMDGPLADFDQAFHALCADRGWTIDVGQSEQTASFATSHMPLPAERLAARHYINTTPGWFRSLPVVPGAVAGMEALAEVADVWVCTKPLESNPTCRDDKAAWLGEHFGSVWVDRLIIAPDKGMVRGDILLDDAPKVQWLAHAEWEPVIFTAGYNGPGSAWDGLRHWTWDRPVADLLGAGR